ncbi:NUDIX domain-containing protein [Paenibacillus filicis]|uniref:NUDIX domain-containing protein n=1 Tax=Paenibacillus gyeongsangnamensis TaxID=3388067 RepID=A0ABT4Q7F7_9BACL|nr:NUDIX domain-containing protein [Paenibacillus filicis]MCZ8512801.1 NUDIX domain-containing protein [Paenibacillus filicis]
MLSQGIVVKASKVLMVKQRVQRGDIVWNFPGGSIEEGESPEAACIREVKEETSYDVKIIELLARSPKKYTYYARLVGDEERGSLKTIVDPDVNEVDWVDLKDDSRFDKVTKPIIELIRKRLDAPDKLTI